MQSDVNSSVCQFDSQPDVDGSIRQVNEWLRAPVVVVLSQQRANVRIILVPKGGNVQSCYHAEQVEDAPGANLEYSPTSYDLSLCALIIGQM